MKIALNVEDSINLLDVPYQMDLLIWRFDTTEIKPIIYNLNPNKAL